jgi:hypothetical protein
VAQAARIYREALGIAAEVQAAPLTLDVLAGLAALHLQCGRLEEALKVAFVVLAHRAATHETRERVGLVRCAAERRLPAGQVRSAAQWAGEHGVEALLGAPA